MNISRHTLAGIGAGLLIIGCFAPLARMPIVGTLTYIQGDGKLVIAAAVLALVIAALRWYRLLLLISLAVFGLILYDGIKVYVGIEQAKQQLSGNMFGALMVGGISMDWGWIVLLAGVVVLGYAGLKREPEPPVVMANG